MPREPEITVDAELFTLQDLVYRLAVRCGSNSSHRDNIHFVRAVQDALRAIPSKYDWSYYKRPVRFTTTASVSGAYSYDHTGGASERLVTLTSPAVWPTDAEMGAVRIGNATYRIDQRLSSSQATLTGFENPGADSTGSLVWRRNSYSLPRQIAKIHYLKNVTRDQALAYMSANDFREADYMLSVESMPSRFTWMYDSSHAGSSQIFVAPYPTAAELYEASVTIVPRLPTINQVAGMDASVTAGSKTVTCASGTFNSRMVGCLFRLSLDSVLPISEDSGHWEFQAFITAATATTLTLATAPTVTAASRGYLVSSPVDIDTTTMLAAVESEAYAQYCRNHKHDSIGGAMGLARADLIDAMIRDNRTNMGRYIDISFSNAGFPNYSVE